MACADCTKLTEEVEALKRKLHLFSLPAKERIQAYLQQNPEARKHRQVKIAEALGLTRETVSRTMANLPGMRRRRSA